MTREEKQLLLKDLCARLPYGVKVLADIDKTFDGGYIGIINKIEPYVGNKFPELKGQYLLYEKGCLTPLVVDEVRPYLRPISSMTDEERELLYAAIKYSGRISIDGDIDMSQQTTMFGIDCCSYIDWLNAHHFDYRRLIEKDLALEAPEGMYNSISE